MSSPALRDARTAPAAAFAASAGFLAVAWWRNWEWTEPFHGSSAFLEAGCVTALAVAALDAVSRQRGLQVIIAGLVAIVTGGIFAMEGLDLTQDWLPFPSGLVHHPISLSLALIALGYLVEGVRPDKARIAGWLGGLACVPLVAGTIERLGDTEAILGFHHETPTPWLLMTVAALGVVALWSAIADRAGPIFRLSDTSLHAHVFRNVALTLVPLGAFFIGAGVFLLRNVEEDRPGRLVASGATLAVVLLAGLTELVAERVAARIARPIETMQQAAARMSSGDYNPSRPVEAPGEIQQLGIYFDDMRRSMEQRSAASDLLREVSHAVGAGTDLSTAFRNFGHAVVAAVPMDRVALAVIDEGGEEIHTLESYGEEKWRLPVGSLVPLSSEYREKLDRGRAVLMSNLSESSHEPSQTWSAIGFQSALVVPVVVSGSARMLVNFMATRPAAIDEQRGALLEAAVREAAATFNALLLLDRQRQAAARLHEVDRLKSEFVGIVAHDLRSPMNVIAGYADTLRLRWSEISDDEKEHFLEVISRTIGELATFIEDVLEVARIESGSLSYTPKPFDIGALVQQTTAEFQTLEPQRKIELNLPEGLPKAMGDEQRYWQVLTNLLSNALKYSEEDSPVEIGVEPSGSELVVSVTDHGLGIEPEDRVHLFEKFARVTQPGRKTPAKGTGLGLFIVRQIVEAQGGRIEVESEVGKGSTFRYTVPVSART